MSAVTGSVNITLRLEGLLLLVVSCSAYAIYGQSWWLFGVLFFIPDISFAAYLINARVGAMAYNAAHSLIGAFILILIGVYADNAVTLAIGIIWCAHIGFDRMLGYGLKYPTSFHDTHLGRIGAAKHSNR